MYQARITIRDKNNETPMLLLFIYDSRRDQVFGTQAYMIFGNSQTKETHEINRQSILYAHFSTIPNQE
jgi:hypothetical protein